jgi:hypothetical protein
MSKKWMFSIFLLLAMFTAKAQFRKIPGDVTDSFKVKYENALGVSWKDRLSSFQADFTIGDKEMKALFTSKGEWIKTETADTYTNIPADVKDGFKKSKYADMDVLDVAQIEDKDNQTQYRIVVKKNDFNKRSLIFSKVGQLISDNASL